MSSGDGLATGAVAAMGSSNKLLLEETDEEDDDDDDDDEEEEEQALPGPRPGPSEPAAAAARSSPRRRLASPRLVRRCIARRRGVAVILLVAGWGEDGGTPGVGDGGDDTNRQLCKKNNVVALPLPLPLPRMVATPPPFAANGPQRTTTGARGDVLALVLLVLPDCLPPIVSDPGVLPLLLLLLLFLAEKNEEEDVAGLVVKNRRARRRRGAPAPMFTFISTRLIIVAGASRCVEWAGGAERSGGGRVY